MVPATSIGRSLGVIYNGTALSPGAAYAMGFGGQWGYYTDLATRSSTADSGFILCTNRWYDPINARWLTRDPTGYDGGIDIYSYVDGNPIMRTDPFGTDWLDSASNFSAGMGDFLSFGATGWARQHLGVDGVVDRSSGAYGGGQAAGLAVSLVDMAAGAVGTLKAVRAAGGAANYVRAGVTSTRAALSTLTKSGNMMDKARAAACFVRQGCFVAGTPVQMADGTTKPIEQVKEGDLVLSRDQDAGADDKIVASRVTRTYQLSHPSDQMVMVTLSSGERIECTDNHPFFVPGSGWIAAGRLCLGTQICPRAGPTGVSSSKDRITVAKVAFCTDHAAGATTVYNFEVAYTHTYFVGKTNGGEWVHNDCIPDLSTSKQAAEGILKGDVRVTTRAEAEELISGVFRGYKNTTGENRWEAFFLSRMNGNSGFYHWAEEIEVKDNIARVAGHGAEDAHGLFRHVQIHTLGAKTVRIFFGDAVR